MIAPDELIVDSFAGGGGASAGIEMALGRSPDIAINHDAEAVAMHAANHPATKHFCQSVWRVDPEAVTGGRPVGLLWASPDCKHFSKAKGGKPVEKHIRDLAWVVVKYARQVKPRVIILENVEEFRDWGPLIFAEDGQIKPCPLRKGATFKSFVRELRRLGYRVEDRELRACDYGAPTIRKRLFLIARRDGRPIVWPRPTHGAPAALKQRSGSAHQLLPYRTAADCIDWSIPCPSIFDRKRPLAEKTMARIARGIRRYVIEAAHPFIVPVTPTEGGPTASLHEDCGDARVHGIDEPLRTVTTAQRGEHALVTPFVASTAHTGSTGRGPAAWPIDKPAQTLTAKADSVLVAAHITKFRGGATGHAADEPLHTVTANSFIERPGGSQPLGLVGAFLKPRYGERPAADGKPGQEPRVLPVDGPMPTVVPTGNGGDLVAAHLVRQFGGSTGSALEDPVGAVMPGGSGKTAMVAAFMAQHNTDMVGHDARKPVSTIVQKGCTQALVEADLVAATLHHTYTSNTAGGEGDPSKPMKTVTAGGQHHALVKAFLLKYYETAIGQRLDDPMHTATARARLGLVTVEGVDYQIVDIGMRMLSPRELFRAQGFPDTYIIDRGPPTAEHPHGKPLTKTAQIRMCGNSVCPPIAAALVRANLGAAQLEESETEAA